VYGNAPIVEAVIDVRTSFDDPEAAFAATGRLAEDMASSFPQRQPIQVVMFGAEAKDGQLVPQPAQYESIGWKLIGGGNDRVLQLTKSGFTYSHLPPYTQWEVFRAEAELLWERYVQASRPNAISRIAVRYINRLKLPAGAINLGDYLAVFPQVPETIPVVSGLLMQLQFPLPEVPGISRASVTLASEDSKETTWQPMVLDLDLSAESPTGFEAAELWGILETLRAKKNELFEACLTPQMKELIA